MDTQNHISCLAQWIRPTLVDFARKRRSCRSECCLSHLKSFLLLFCSRYHMPTQSMRSPVCGEEESETWASFLLCSVRCMCVKYFFIMRDELKRKICIPSYQLVQYLRWCFYRNAWEFLKNNFGVIYFVE